MITRPRILKNVLIVLVLVGEPALFACPLPVSIYLLVLKESWPFQAVAAFGLLLTGMPWPYALKNAVIAALLTGEALLFSSNDRAFAPFIILLIFSFPVQVIFFVCLVLADLDMLRGSLARRIITLGLAIPYAIGLSLYFAPLFWGAEQVRNTAQLGENRFYFTVATPRMGLGAKEGGTGPGCDFGCNRSLTSLYKCNSVGVECELIYDYDFSNVEKSNLVVDRNANEVQLLLSSTGGPDYKHYGLEYVYGKPSRRIISSEEIRGQVYYLTDARYVVSPPYAIPNNDEPITYTLYQCNQDSLGCRRLPFEFATTVSDDVEMDVDRHSRLNITGWMNINKSRLIYSYNARRSHAICYAAGCSTKDK